MQRTLDLIIENRALKEYLNLYSALLDEVYKHLRLGNIEAASVLIEYSLKKENEDGKENNRN